MPSTCNSYRIASSFSFTFDSIVPLMARSKNGRSICTRTSFSVTATSPFVPFAAPDGASKRIASPAQCHCSEKRDSIDFANSSARFFASSLGRVCARVMSIGAMNSSQEPRTARLVESLDDPVPARGLERIAHRPHGHRERDVLGPRLEDAAREVPHVVGGPAVAADDPRVKVGLRVGRELL